MSKFEDIVHHVATIGEHVVEFVDGKKEVTINGHTFTAAEVLSLVESVGEAVTRLGITA